MADLPPPDVMDQSGRMRRVVLALVIGIVAASIAYLICDSLAKPETLPNNLAVSGSAVRAYKFVYYMTGLAGAVAFSITLAIANHRARRKWRESLVAPARQVR